MHARTRTQAGFSLIEVLVSLAIFAVVVTMGVGSMLVLIDANAKAQNTQQVINNVSFMLDGLVRDLRTGYGYYCDDDMEDINDEFGNNDELNTNDCDSDVDNAIVFTETGGSLTGPSTGSNRIGYRRVVVDGRGVIQRRLGSGGGWSPVTAPDVDITTFDIIVEGTDRTSDGDTKSPTVTIFIEGETETLTGLRSDFALQTTLTQQTLDL